MEGKGMRFGYTVDDRKDEIERLGQVNCDEIVVEKLLYSRKTSKIRWSELINRLTPEDTLVLVDLTCLGRTVSEMLRAFLQIPCEVEFLDDRLEPDKLKKMAPILLEMEKSVISNRTKKGLSKSSKKSGRPRKWDDPAFQQKFMYYVKEDMNVSEVCKKLNISRTTFYRILHTLTEDQQKQMEKKIVHNEIEQEMKEALLK
jgi:DNA invertase Pin-like site-specific DNA recombinase